MNLASINFKVKNLFNPAAKEASSIARFGMSGINIDKTPSKDTFVLSKKTESDGKIDISNKNSNKKEVTFKGNSHSFVDKEQYNLILRELITERLQGYTEEQITDAINNMNNGNFSAYPITEVDFQSIKNTAFLNLFEKDNLVEIENRRFYVTKEQKSKFEEFCKKRENQSIDEDYCYELIQSDVMFLEAAAINAGINIDGKSSQEIFNELSSYVFLNEDENTGKVFGIGNSYELDQYAEAYLGRYDVHDSISKVKIKDHTNNTIGSVSGDKAVHEINKSLAEKFKSDPKFREKFVEYCSKSDKYKKYSALADMYKNDLREKMSEMGSISRSDAENIINKSIENENHLIFRAIQRDALANLEAAKSKGFMQITGEEDYSFTSTLAEKLLTGDRSPEFMGRILTTEGTDKIHTIEYNFKNGKWEKDAVYIPKAV